MAWRICLPLRRGVSHEMGGGRLAKKSLCEVGGSRILDQDVGGLDFASKLRDVGGFVLKDFHQSKDIKLTQIKQYQMYPRPDPIETSAFKISISLEYPGTYALGHKSYFLKTFITVPAFLSRKLTNNI